MRSCGHDESGSQCAALSLGHKITMAADVNNTSRTAVTIFHNHIMQTQFPILPTIPIDVLVHHVFPCFQLSALICCSSTCKSLSRASARFIFEKKFTIKKEHTRIFQELLRWGPVTLLHWFQQVLKYPNYKSRKWDTEFSTIAAEGESAYLSLLIVRLIFFGSIAS